MKVMIGYIDGACLMGVCIIVRYQAPDASTYAVASVIGLIASIVRAALVLVEVLRKRREARVGDDLDN